MKKFISMLLVIIITFATINSVYAEGYSEGNFLFEIVNGEVTITLYDGFSVEHVEVPAAIRGFQVTSIGEGAFRGRTNMQSVEIPDSVISIGKNAFYQCENLQFVKLSENLVEIGNSAFSNCHNLSNVIFPESLISIGNFAFWGTSLTETELPKNLVSIGEHAFSGTKMTYIEIPESVTLIGSNAFANTSLKTVKLPNGLTEISDGTFFDSSLTSIEIPLNVSVIGNAAFKGCKNLTSITIPKNVKEILPDAFEECSNLTTVVIEEGITSIPEPIFNNCTSLTTVVVNNSVEQLSSDEFFNFWRRRSVDMKDFTSIPETLTLYGNKGSYIESYSKKQGVLFRELVTAKFNGELMVFDQPPIIESDRTLVPLRAIFEAFGATVEWDEATKTITANKATITLSLQIGSNILYKNDEQIMLDVPAKIIGGRTLVPIRAISESFGAQVNWNGDLKMVEIFS